MRKDQRFRIEQLESELEAFLQLFPDRKVRGLMLQRTMTKFKPEIEEEGKDKIVQCYIDYFDFRMEDLYRDYKR